LNKNEKGHIVNKLSFLSSKKQDVLIPGIQTAYFIIFIGFSLPVAIVTMSSDDVSSKAEKPRVRVPILSNDIIDDLLK